MKRKKLLIVLTTIILIIAIIIIFLSFRGKETVAPVSALPTNEEQPISQEVLDSFNYSESQLKEMVSAIAKEKFGDNCYIIPLTPGKPSYAEIFGVKRYVYIYGAGSLNDNLETKAIYHADLITCEIFDNGSGQMKKVQ